MKSLISDNYASIVARGLITEKTSEHDFLKKLDEEVIELKYAVQVSELYGDDNVKEELADCIMVLLNYANHFNIDIEQEIRNKIKVNYKRAKQ